MSDAEQLTDGALFTEDMVRDALAHLYDSAYLRDGVTRWIRGWKLNGWKTAEKKPVKNEDLWRELDELLGRHCVRFTHVRGHSGHPENERCDTLAVAAYQKYLR